MHFAPHTIQGIHLTELSQTFGTPLYVYDGEKIVAQLRTLQQTFAASDVKVKYATKALTNLSVLHLLKLHGAGIDVVSVNEAKIALRAGFAPRDIMFTSNSVSLDEISEAVSLGISVNMDNLSILGQFGRKYGSSFPCCIRLNPGIMAGGHIKIATGHDQSKFGIPVEQLSAVKEIIDKYNLVVTGLHIHTGSELKDVDIFMKMANILFHLAVDFPHLEFLDFGGGLKVAYKADDPTTDIPALGVKLNQAFKDFQQRHGRKLSLWLEPGKFIVSEAGLLLAQVTVVKKNPNITFVGVNTGLNHLIRPMMYDAHHEIVNVSNFSEKKHTYTIVGNICETDTLGADRELSEVNEGDLIAIYNAGAYGFSMASNYNSRFRPAEVLIWKGEAKLIRERDTLDDILRGQIDIFSE
jgi:diaminopimelate decarboxylase